MKPLVHGGRPDCGSAAVVRVQTSVTYGRWTPPFIDFPFEQNISLGWQPISSSSNQPTINHSPLLYMTLKFHLSRRFLRSVGWHCLDRTSLFLLFIYIYIYIFFFFFSSRSSRFYLVPCIDTSLFGLFDLVIAMLLGPCRVGDEHHDSITPSESSTTE